MFWMEPATATRVPTTRAGIAYDVRIGRLTLTPSFAPGLYRHERKAILPFLLATPVMFILGAAFVYYLMLPRATVRSDNHGPDAHGGGAPWWQKYLKPS